MGIFQLAVRDIVTGVSAILSKMEVSCESFCRSLSRKGKARFLTLSKLVD